MCFCGLVSRPGEKLVGTRLRHAGAKQPESEATLAADKVQHVMVRMSPELHEEVKEVAEKYDLSMAQAIRTAIRMWVKEPTLVG